MLSKSPGRADSMSFLEYLGVPPKLPAFAARLLRALPEDERGLWRFDADRSALVR